MLQIQSEQRSNAISDLIRAFTSVAVNPVQELERINKEILVHRKIIDDIHVEWKSLYGKLPLSWQEEPKITEAKSETSRLLCNSYSPRI